MIVDLTCPCFFVISGVEVVRPIMYTGKKKLTVCNKYSAVHSPNRSGGRRSEDEFSQGLLITVTSLKFETFFFLIFICISLIFLVQAPSTDSVPYSPTHSTSSQEHPYHPGEFLRS